MKKVNKWFILPLSIGLIILIVGILMLTVGFPTIIEKEVFSNVELKEGTQQFDRFKKIPFPFYFNVYLFEITNFEDVLKGGKPNVREVGPFVYKEEREKIIHGIQKDEISYSDSLIYTFDQEASGNNFEDQDIVVLNSPLLAVMQSLEDIPFNLGVTMEVILSNIFENANIFMKVKVKDLTFGGIKMCHIPNPIGVAKLVCLLIMLMNQKLLEYHEDLTISFSLFKYKTEINGPFTLNDGRNDRDKLGLITSYKGQEYTQLWEGENTECDRASGFYTTYPPFMEEGASFKVYSTDICKPIIIEQTSLSDYKEIPSFKFQTTTKSFASEAEKCVCIDMTKGFDGETRCFSNAVLDMNTCMGVPVILSHPHLMWAEQDLKDSVTGLGPSEEKHNTIIDFEPHLGYPLTGNIRLQFNMILRPSKFGNSIVETTKNLPKSVIPLLWVDNNFKFTESLVEEINTKLLDMLQLAEIVQWVLVGVGALVAIVSLLLLLICRKK